MKITFQFFSSLSFKTSAILYLWASFWTFISLPSARKNKTQWEVECKRIMKMNGVKNVKIDCHYVFEPLINQEWKRQLTEKSRNKAIGSDLKSCTFTYSPFYPQTSFSFRNHAPVSNRNPNSNQSISIIVTVCKWL